MRVAVFWTLAALVACACAAEQKKIVCYFGSWAVYRPGNGEISIENEIDASLCTHLIYTFVGLNADGTINILDKWADLPDAGGRDGYNKFNQLRNGNPRTRTLVAIGGWNEGSVTYSKVAADPALRATFVESAATFVRKYGFDGLDFDWEYPNQRGGSLKDRENYVLLLKELRKRFDEEGLLLSAALAAAQSSASKSYIVPEVVKYLDLVNLMAYDLHGLWDKTTGVNAPLYAGSWERGDQRLLNVNASINWWISQGAAPEKLILGIPFYGRSFSLDDQSQTGIGAPATAPGRAGPYTRQAGTLGYNEICEDQDWKETWQEEQRVPYAVKGDQWVGYENPRSVQEKAEFINRLGLGGVMAWSIETDDFKGICGEKNPLLKTLNHVLHGGAPLPPTSATTKAPDAEVKCRTTGFVSHPKKCSVFYVCVQNASGGFDSHELNCSKGQFFDKVQMRCNYPNLVRC
ncbi:chitinase-3-like protein 1 [Nasonia vitripennis]|uniref:Chitinase n=1 Tax=Nasonia vitripennis TaxID=7425 RepID=A0A7M7G2E1_NASVI|nr:chitinase-3-like protein 1 [Nasonia vitripennis]